MARIMIVEDEPITAADLEQKVLEMGHQVSAWVDSGEDAVERAQQLSPDLILMDVRLRGAMDGIHAAQEIRRQSPVPILFLTAFGDQDTVDKACKAEPFGYLLKPFSERAVAAAVQVALTRAQAERAQRERERWVSAGLGCAEDSLVAVDQSGAVCFINEHAQALLELRDQEALGKDARSLIPLTATEHPLDRTHPLDLALREGRVISHGRCSLGLAHGEPRALASYSASPVLAPDGRPAGAVLVMRALREEAPALERLDVLRSLSLQLSHEINNPLSYNLGALHLALAELDKLRAMSALDARRGEASSRERGEHVARIESLLRSAEEGANRVAGVLRELGSFPLWERELSPLQVTALIELAMGLGGTDIVGRVRILRQVDGLPMIRGNKWQLARVLAHLLQSAAEALAKRGADGQDIDLSVGLDARGWLELRVLARWSLVAHLQRKTRLFDGPPPPTSVGATVAQQVVESHGGELMLHERADAREFVLHLPPLRLSSPPPRPELESTRGSVLIVDDEPAMGRVLEIALQPVHDVTAVQSAESALALLERGEAFDVILCDLLMPGMNGKEFYDRLRTMRPDLTARVIFMSAGATTADGERLLAEMAGRVIQKPFRTEQLLALLAERVRARKLSRASPRPDRTS